MLILILVLIVIALLVISQETRPKSQPRIIREPGMVQDQHPELCDHPYVKELINHASKAKVVRK